MAEDLNISPEMIENLMNMLKNSNSSNNNETSENNQSNTFENKNLNLDIDTIVKMKKIMENINNKNDPRSNLLYSLKPYLRKSRQSKLDQYANLLKITQFADLFQNEKGEK